MKCYSKALGRDVLISCDPTSSSPYEVGKAYFNKAEILLLSLYGERLGNNVTVSLPRDTIYLHA